MEHPTRTEDRRLDYAFSPASSDRANLRTELIQDRGLTSPASAQEESLIVDDRSDLSPARAVEEKLMSLLRNASLPVSHLQMRGLVRARCEV